MKFEESESAKIKAAMAKTKGKIQNQHNQRSKQKKIGVQPYPTFNDPLYEYLDNEVLNREQHNFGPWVEHERLKSREKRTRLQKAGFPALIHSPQRQIQSNSEVTTRQTVLPILRQRNARAFSLQNLRAASLEFQPVRSSPIQQRQLLHSSLKSPFFLKMHGCYVPKVKEDSFTKKSNFVYNYCLEENIEICKPINKKESYRKASGKYLQLGANQESIQHMTKSNNLRLIEELKLYRLQKIK